MYQFSKEEVKKEEDGKINNDVLTVQKLIIRISCGHLMMILPGKAGGN